MKKHIIQPSFDYFFDLTRQILIICIIFSAVGMTLFGGNINTYTIDTYNADMNTKIDFEYLNFNTFANSFIFMFVIALNDNWPVLANLCVLDKTGWNVEYMKFIFVFYKFFVHYILLYSTIGFIIEILHEYEIIGINMMKTVKGYE